jgi:hypothetical protein
MTALPQWQSRALGIDAGTADRAETGDITPVKTPA